MSELNRLELDKLKKRIAELEKKIDGLYKSDWVLDVNLRLKNIEEWTNKIPQWFTRIEKLENNLNDVETLIGFNHVSQLERTTPILEQLSELKNHLNDCSNRVQGLHNQEKGIREVLREHLQTHFVLADCDRDDPLNIDNWRSDLKSLLKKLKVTPYANGQDKLGGDTKECPHGTFGGSEHCMKCRPELMKPSQPPSIGLKELAEQQREIWKKENKPFVEALDSLDKNPSEQDASSASHTEKTCETCFFEGNINEPSLYCSCQKTCTNYDQWIPKEKENQSLKKEKEPPEEKNGD